MRHNIRRTVRRMAFMSGATYTGKALEYAEKNLFPEARGGDVPKVAIVSTDGQSQDAVNGPAESLRHAGVSVYVIGIKFKITDVPSEVHRYRICPKERRVSERAPDL